MITIESTNDAFTATINAYPIEGSSRVMVYTGEKIIISLHNATAEMVTFELNDIAYHSDNNGDLMVDVTDLIRANASKYTQMDIDIYQGADNATFELKFHAGIYPDHVMMPVPPLFAGDSSLTSVQIVPPSVFYTHPVLSLAYAMAMEVHGIVASTAWVATFKDDYQNDGTLTPTNDSLELPNVNTNGDPDWVNELAHGDTGMLVVATELDACENACVLQWLSATGVMKRAIWRVKKVQKTATTQKLLAFGDGYKWQRGHDVTFVACIDGLDAYSAAYYADIITSGNVHCAVAPGEDLNSDFTSVSVATDSFMIADGDAGQLQSLEITINFKNYDVL